MANRRLNDFDRATSAYIRATAAAKKMGQYEVAEKAGIHINTFRPYWRGERAISLGDFSVILDVLGVDGEDAMRDIKRIIATGNYSD